MLDPSVRKVASSFRRVCSPSSVGMIHRLDMPIHGYVPALPRIGEAPALSGAESTTYRTKSSSSEHENPELSAEAANLGKLPSPARSQPGGRAPIVVRAWESHAQGDGGQ